MTLVTAWLILQVRRLKCDLSLCYKIIHNEITILNDDLLVFSDFTRTRGHCYKLLKGCSRVNAHKYFFLNRITEIWNDLPSTVLEASSFNVFKWMLDCVDLTKCCLFSFLRFVVFWSVRNLMYLHIYICLSFCAFYCMCLCVYMYVIYVRASVSGLLRPFLSYGFYPLKSSFIHSACVYACVWRWRIVAKRLNGSSWFLVRGLPQRTTILWRLGLVVVRVGLDRRSYSTPGPVSIVGWVTRQWVDKQPRFVTSHSGQLSLPPWVGRKMSIGQSVATLYGWRVKAGMAHSTCG